MKNIRNSFFGAEEFISQKWQSEIITTTTTTKLNKKKNRI